MDNRFSNLEIMKLIKKIEETFPVETWVMNDIYIWPVIRNSFPALFIEHAQFVSSESSIQNKQKISTMFECIQTLFFLIRDFFSFIVLIIIILLSKKKDVMLIGDGISYTKIQNMWVDRFCDPIVNTLKQNNQSFFLLEQLKNKNDKVIHKYMPISCIERLSYFFARIKSVFVESTYSLDGYDDFLNMKELQSIKKYIVQKELSITADKIKIASYFFSFVMKKIKIKRAFIVCYYGILGYALALAGRKNRVDVVDIEHGSIINCPAYCGWGKVPYGGYELVPNKFGLWHSVLEDEYTATNSEAFKKHHTAYIEGLQIIKYTQKTNDFTLENIKQKFSTIILVTLQPQFYGYDDWKKLAHSIPLLPKTWGWIIRKHPAYKDLNRMDEILGLKLENVIYDNCKYNLYESLQYANCHVTTASASCLDAMIMSVPTVFISQVGIEDFKCLIDQKYALYCADMNDLKKKIEFFLERK